MVAGTISVTFTPRDELMYGTRAMLLMGFILVWFGLVFQAVSAGKVGKIAREKESAMSFWEIFKGEKWNCVVGKEDLRT